MATYYRRSRVTGRRDDGHTSLPFRDHHTSSRYPLIWPRLPKHDIDDFSISTRCARQARRDGARRADDFAWLADNSKIPPDMSPLTHAPAAQAC